MQGAKAYILPAVAALLLVGWWVFGPETDATPSDGAATEDAGEPEGTERPAPAPPAGPLDQALDAALAECGDLASDGVRTLQVRLAAGEDGQATIASVAVAPTDATGPAVTCAKALAGRALPTNAPVAAVTRTRSFTAEATR